MMSEISIKIRGRSFIKLLALLCVVLLCSGLLSGCGKKVVLTTGLKKNEVFRLGEASCMLPEAMVYLTNLQNQYEAVFGEEIWSAKGAGTSLEEEAKDQVLAQLAQIKAMTLLAEEKGIVLESIEEDRAKAAGKEYFASLNDTEKNLLGVEEKTVIEMYREYALAQKVYKQIVANVNPEISDDEARTITVLIIRLTDREKAKEVWEKAQQEGVDFESLATTESEDTAVRLSFGKGEIAQPIETAAFNLGKNEMSDIVESDGSFYILKCINTFDEAQTQLNKEKILEERQKEAFNQEYHAFVDALTRQINDELWDSVSFIRDENVTTDCFFEIYATYFQVS